MKKLILPILALLLTASLYGQQEQHYTKFMFNKIALNPAYAGSSGLACIGAFARTQWIGFEGGPQTQLVTWDMPLVHNRIGLGASVVRFAIGPQVSYTGEVSYAYRFPLGRGHMSLGLQGSIRYFQVDFSKTESTNGNDTDGVIPVGIQSKYLPNFGPGIYYNTKSYYFGFSVPRIIQNSLFLADGEDSELSKETPHYYLMGGARFPLGGAVDLEPQALLTYVKDIPFEAIINVNFIFANRVLLGASYRLGGDKGQGAGADLAITGGVDITRNLYFGMAYDIGLSQLKDQHSGSLEFFLRWCFNKKGDDDEFLNPRFF